jgi:hypothetical protein
LDRYFAVATAVAVIIAGKTVFAVAVLGGHVAVVSIIADVE